MILIVRNCRAFCALFHPFPVSKPSPPRPEPPVPDEGFDPPTADPTVGAAHFSKPFVFRHDRRTHSLFRRRRPFRLDSGTPRGGARDSLSRRTAYRILKAHHAVGPQSFRPLGRRRRFHASQLGDAHARGGVVLPAPAARARKIGRFGESLSLCFEGGCEGCLAADA